MNLVEQWFPQSVNTDDIIIDNMCLVMQFYGLSKRELDELSIPEYLIMQKYAVKQEKKMNKLMGSLRMPKIKTR